MTARLLTTEGEPPRPNRAQINEHLYALFAPEFARDYPDAWIEIAFADMAGDGTPHAAEHFSPFELEQAAAFAEKKNIAGCNVYVGPALRQGETGPSGRSSADNFLASAYAWADSDDAAGFDRMNDALEASALPTSLSVMTGRTPHRRAHLYFKFDGKATKDQVRCANVALKKLLGTDDVEDVCRVMRLAGTVSYPSEKKRARGYVTELVTLHTRKNVPRYSIERLTGSATADSSADPARARRTDDDVVALLEASRIAGKWHNSVREAIASMIGRGWSDLQIRLACAAYCKGGANDPDLDDLIDRARAKWDKPDAAGKQSKPPGLIRLELARYDTEPIPEREWGVRDRFPRRNVCLLSGEGGVGKSILLLQLGVAHVLGRDWLRSMPEQGPVVAVNCEDEGDELARRLDPILRSHHAGFGDVDGDLHAFSLTDCDPLLAWLDRSGRISPTPLYQLLMETVREFQPICTIVDNVADVFGGSEIDRTQVRQFVSLMRQIALAANGYVIMSAHPSLAGITSKSGLSGSTQWHNSVRARGYVHTEKYDVAENGTTSRVLDFMKSNYSALSERVELQWSSGLFVPVRAPSGPEQTAKNAEIDALFLDLLDRAMAKGENLSAAGTANNYAPSRFAKVGLAKARGVGRDHFADALDRLLAADKVVVETYGPASKLHKRIARRSF